MKSNLINLLGRIGLLSVLVFSLSAVNLYAENHARPHSEANLYGVVKNAETGEGVAYINVMIKGTLVATMTDATGHYFLKDIPTGKQVVVVSGIGYFPVETVVRFKAHNTVSKNFSVKEDKMSLDEVVVTSNRMATLRKLAPTLVSVLDSKIFEETHAGTLAQGLRFQPGVRVEDNCQNCGFSQVRINGLDGHYSQILIDSRPIFSALNGVYGLEQIPANMIDRVEVVRGGGSALFGASAVGGTINIITKEPTRNSAQFSQTVSSFSNFKNEFHAMEYNTMINASIVSPDNNAGFAVYAQDHSRKGVDLDGDGYTELPTLKNMTVGASAYFKLSSLAKLSFDYHGMRESRRGGDRQDYPDFQAGISEHLKHYIQGGGVNFDYHSADYKDRVSAYFSFQNTLRRSFYGGGGISLDSLDAALNGEMPEISGDATTKEAYEKEAAKVEAWENEISKFTNKQLHDLRVAVGAYGLTTDLTTVSGLQYIHHFDNCLFMPSNLTLGLEHNYDRLVNKVLGYSNENDDQHLHIFSAYGQNEWTNKIWTVLLGARVDKHQLVKTPIVSPRINLRFNPSDAINLRASYAAGFRAPQIFDEDLHVELVSGERKPVKVDPNLKPEFSHSFSFSADLYHSFGALQTNLLIEGFYTRINGIFTNIDKTDFTYKTNAHGKGAHVCGVNLESKLAYSHWFEVQGGLTIQRSLFDEAQTVVEQSQASKALRNAKNIESKVFMRTPNVYGYFTARITPVNNFNISLSGTYTGSMYVPHAATDDNHPDATLTKSQSFLTIDAKLAYNFLLYNSVNMQLNCGVGNLFNSFQHDFDQGDSRDSAYIYGPTLPRNVFAGVKFNF